MANPLHLEKLNEGVEAWNKWRGDQEAFGDLSDADLAGRDLTGIDLRGTNLQHAKLRGAKLGRDGRLCDADIRDADLCQADLSGADLTEIHCAGADLRRANLRETNLQGADLSGSIGALRTEQLAGANLTGAKLPEQLKTLYDKLENVKGISESARKIFLAVLAACLYCWLTIATTTDVNLITNRASSPLPIIQTQIPIAGFYVVAPLLVLCVYFYFHFYLQKLWEELGSLPAVFPDGRPLYTKVDPWLLNDLVRSHLPKLNIDRPFLPYLQLWISVLLAWWIVPVTMLLFWGRYLRRHERIGTTFHVALLVISLVGAVCLYRLAVATLQGRDRVAFRWKGIVKSRRGYQTAAFATAALVFFAWVSWETRWADQKSLVSRIMTHAGYIPFAHLSGAEVSQIKGTLSPNQYKDPYVIMQSKLDGTYDKDRGLLLGAHLSGTNLRCAEASGSFLAAADLAGADLSGASLIDADLWEAQLIDTDLGGANLAGAVLTDAILWHANLQGAKLTEARLIFADLSGANLKGTNLWRADVSFADLTDVRNLDPEEVKQALNWEHASYDRRTLKALGLPIDHNDAVANELEEKVRGYANAQQKRNPEQRP
jgi:uncharacterized protein YjbI with pentapeptide repeats